MWGFCILACFSLERIAIKYRKQKRPVPCRHQEFLDSASRHLHPLGPHWPHNQEADSVQTSSHGSVVPYFDATRKYFLRAAKCQALGQCYLSSTLAGFRSFAPQPIVNICCFPCPLKHILIQHETLLPAPDFRGGFRSQQTIVIGLMRVTPRAVIVSSTQEACPFWLDRSWKGMGWSYYSHFFCYCTGWTCWEWSLEIECETKSSGSEIKVLTFKSSHS